MISQITDLAKKILPWGLLVLIALLGYYILKKEKIIVGKETTVTKIIEHKDTLRDTIKKPVFYVKQLPRETVYVNKTTHDTIRQTIKDSTNCYKFSKNWPDGAVTGAEICSKFFVPTLTDVVCELSYKAAPDTQRTVFRVDTLTKKPKYAPCIAIAGGVGFILGSVATGVLVSNLKK